MHVPVHVNDAAVFVTDKPSPEHPARRLRTASYKALQYGFTGPIPERSHALLLSFFPAYTSVKDEVATLMAGSMNRAEHVLGFLLNPGDRLVNQDAPDLGILKPLQANLRDHGGQQVEFRFNKQFHPVLQ